MRAPEQGNGKAAEIATRDRDSLRCHCGSLIARLVPHGVEIKCRRCKRRIVIPLRADTSYDPNERAV